MRALFAVAAAALATIASVLASLDGHADFVPFYAGLSFCAAIAAAVAHEPFVGTRRQVARAAAVVWAVAALWVGVLFVMANSVWQASGPPPTPEQAFLGIPASVYYAAALYGGALLMLLVAVTPDSGTDARSAERPSQVAPNRPLEGPV